MQLFLDVMQQRKIPAAICSNDAKSCYDRIVHGFAALAALRLGVSLMAIEVMFGTIQQLKHFIQTAYGDSLQSFLGTKSLKPIQGLGQGNGASPAIWAIVSSPILDLVRNVGYGIKLRSSVSRSKITTVGNGFVDDMDLLAANDMNHSATDLVQSMQEGLDRWESGLRASGGTLSANKSCWTLIDFEWVGDNWKYSLCATQPANLQMNDYTGNWMTLQQMESNQVERMLGVQLAADGNMEAEYGFRLSQAQTWAAQVATYKAKSTIQWLNFQLVLLPKILYSLMTTTFTKQECENILHPAILQLLPAIGIN